MKTTGRAELSAGPLGECIVTLTVDRTYAQAVADIPQGLLDIEITAHKKRRSLNANALLWRCLGEIAMSLRADKWDIYLRMLRRYGQYTYICARPEAVPMLKRQWRECEVVGDIDIQGETVVQLLCYYGSSTYDTAEFSALLDGVISEMTEMGLPTPMPEEVRRSLEAWEKQRGMVGGKA